MTRLVRMTALAAALTALGSSAVACGRASATDHARTVTVTIRYSSFEPARIHVEPGETVRFVVVNEDPIAHEFIVGGELVQQIHEEGAEAHHPPKPGEISVPAGTTRTTRYRFPAVDDPLLFACHLPGHYAFGMVGTFEIG